MALVNLTLQGKGGVGKSFVASLLAQYYQGTGSPLLAFDTDPVNQTFAGYSSFGVETIRLGDRADEVNPRSFDVLMQKIMEAPAEAVVVIDNGAATFLPLLGYMVENEAISLLQGAGHEVRVHSVLTGGQALADTVMGLDQVFSYFTTAQVVVWLNEYFGRVERTRQDGTAEPFEASALYRHHTDRIHALVRLPAVRKETYGHDVEKLMQARLSFKEAEDHEDFDLMTRHRLKQMWRTISGAMEQAHL